MQDSLITFGTECSVSLRAVFAVQQHEKVQSLKQSGVNRGGGNYKFFTQNDLDVVEKLLVEHNCMVLFGVDANTIRSGYDRVRSRKGEEYDRLTTHCQAHGLYRVVCASNPNDYVEVATYGFKVDLTSDKALGAATIAKRYGAMHMFGIATTEADPDGADIRTADNNDLLRPASSKTFGANLAGGKSPTPMKLLPTK